MFYNAVKEISDFSCGKVRFEKLVNLPFLAHLVAVFVFFETAALFIEILFLSLPQ